MFSSLAPSGHQWPFSASFQPKICELYLVDETPPVKTESTESVLLQHTKIKKLIGSSLAQNNVPEVILHAFMNYVYFVTQRYGGPGSQNVDSRFSVEWNHYLASGLDFVAAHIDVRGTGFVGKGFMHAVHHQLGVLEASDSLHVVRWNTQTTQNPTITFTVS